MMKTVGVTSLDNLVDRTVPHSIRLDKVRRIHSLLVLDTRASVCIEERGERVGLATCGALRAGAPDPRDAISITDRRGRGGRRREC